MCSPIDPVFEFSEIGHHGIERWSFSKEHLPHVPVVAPNLRNVDVRRAHPKASGLGQIVPRRRFTKENLLVLHNGCQQTEIFHRKLAVLVPIQTGQVVVVPRESGRHLARMEDGMEQRGLLPKCALRTKDVDFGGRLSKEARNSVSNVRLDRLPLRRPNIPAASELQANDGTNVRAEAVQIRLQAERVGEQEALPIGIGRILADLPIRLPEDRAK